MAVPPTVPTSFVPRPSAVALRHGFDFGGALSFVGYGAFVLALFFAGGVFAYKWYLTNAEVAKQAELEAAIAAIDPLTVESFIGLNNRLVEGRRVLSEHLILSDTFDLFEALTPTSVRLTALSVTATDARSAILRVSGTATSFNALAALSSFVGKERHLKDAVFSNITVTKGAGVGFTLSATIDPALIAFTADSFTPSPPPVGTTPAATTTPTTP